MTATCGRTVRWELGTGEQEFRDDEALPLLLALVMALAESGLNNRLK